MADQKETSYAEDGISPFALQEAFPDAQGIFDNRYPPLEQIKEVCFVALDANVLLLPYKLENVSLPDVIAVYRNLADQHRLIIPSQAAREFAKHRSTKVADIVKHLHQQAGLSGPRLDKKIGALIGNASYEAAKALANEVGTKIKELQTSINKLADEIAANVGEDPVSVAYRDIFGKCVKDHPNECNNLESFICELKQRYKNRRPPGYKDGSKPDSGAGDLLIWKTIINHGAISKLDCIFVTADEKADWYVQSSGPFHPRLELLEEYRSITNKTLHIIPLSRLMLLFKASSETVEDVQNAENFNNEPDDYENAAVSNHHRIRSTIAERRQRRDVLQNLALIEKQIENGRATLEALPDPTGNMSLPWERHRRVQELGLLELLKTRDQLRRKLLGDTDDLMGEN